MYPQQEQVLEDGNLQKQLEYIVFINIYLILTQKVKNNKGWYEVFIWSAKNKPEISLVYYGFNLLVLIYF